MTEQLSTYNIQLNCFAIYLKLTQHCKLIIFQYNLKKKKTPENSLAVQWLRLSVFTWGQVQSLIRELRSCKRCNMVQIKKNLTNMLRLPQTSEAHLEMLQRQVTSLKLALDHFLTPRHSPSTFHVVLSSLKRISLQ